MAPRFLTVGIDVGGTFTDLLAVDPRSNTVKLAKVPTTVDNQAIGFMAALAAADADPATVQALVHGTTTTTNALLERKIAKVGLITTKGFRDVLELGRRTRPQPYGLRGTFNPLIDREVRLEVPERMDADGKVLIALDEAAVAEAAKKLIALGCEAVVIHFLHSYINPAHEKRAAEIVHALWPNGYITAGHAILSEYREYERGVTAAVNASVQPVLDRYLTRLRLELLGKSFDRDILVMQGNGGTASSQFIALSAVNTVMSGPASGVMAAAYTGRASGHPNLITYDMGGTSTDVGLIENAVPTVSGRCAPDRRRRRLDRHGRCGGHAARRAGERRRPARADLLRPRRERTYHHRRQPGAGPAQSRPAAGRRPSGDPRSCAWPDRAEGRQATRGRGPLRAGGRDRPWPRPADRRRAGRRRRGGGGGRRQDGRIPAQQHRPRHPPLRSSARAHRR